MSTLEKSLNQAELNAKERDLQNTLDLSEVEKQEKIANELGYGLYKINSKNRSPFAQLNFENIHVLIEKEHISTNELGFITALGQYLTMGSNAIKNKKTDQFLTITDLSKVFNKTRVSISNTVQTLIDKGLILEIVSGKEIKKYKRNVNARPLFVNPEVMYIGDRNFIDPMLCDLVIEFDYIEQNKILLPWKVWHESDKEYGRLYKRSTYLKFKKKK